MCSRMKYKKQFKQLFHLFSASYHHNPKSIYNFWKSNIALWMTLVGWSWKIVQHSSFFPKWSRFYKYFLKSYGMHCIVLYEMQQVLFLLYFYCVGLYRKNFEEQKKPTATTKNEQYIFFCIFERKDKRIFNIIILV